jgi:hypothetical protein
MMVGLSLFRDRGCSLGQDEKKPESEDCFDFFRSLVRMPIRKEVTGRIF